MTKSQKWTIKNAHPDNYYDKAAMFYRSNPPHKGATEVNVKSP